MVKCLNEREDWSIYASDELGLIERLLALLVGLANERLLFELQKNGTHAAHVLGVLVGLGVEVAELGHAVPLLSGRLRVT